MAKAWWNKGEGLDIAEMCRRGNKLLALRSVHQVAGLKRLCWLMEVDWKAAQACMGMARTVGTGRGGVDWGLVARRRKRVMALLSIWWDWDFAEEEKRRVREELDHPSAETKP